MQDLMKGGKWLGVLGLGLLVACGGSDPKPVPFENQGAGQENQETEENSQPMVPEFYTYDEEGMPGEGPAMTQVATIDDGVRAPNDLDFHSSEDRSDELWVLNEGGRFGGETVTLFQAGTENQDAMKLQDGNAGHFMASPPAISFGDDGNWATSCGVQDANFSGGTFSGPSLWSSDFEIYAEVGNQPSAEVNGSHLDMLHGSPFSMGITHDSGNAYWVFDGWNEELVRYDFQVPHYPGGDDHSDGLVHRYSEVELTMVEGIPSHLILDKETGWLYINDTGTKRVLRVNTNTGEMARELSLINEPLTEHWEMENVEFEVLVDEGLDTPVGIALNEGRLFVSDYGTGEVIAFDKESGEELARIDARDGIRGITIGPDEKIWFVDYDYHMVYRVDPR